MATAPSTSTPVLFVWSSDSPVGRENLEWGLQTKTWGFKAPVEGAPSNAQFILFGRLLRTPTGGSPRQPLSEWQPGRADLILGLIDAPSYRGTSPHWPDEITDNVVRYPHRIGFTEVTSIEDVALTSVLAPEALESLRRAAISNRGIVELTDLSALWTALDIAEPSPTSQVDLSRTAGTEPVDVAPTTSPNTNGAPRSDDPALRTAVEKHAVALATEHMIKLGWTVRELGKPYDLVCAKADGSEKHVEVKGTTGAGASVNYTPNEVEHFRNCPFGADLVVVRDISVDKSSEPYFTSGGTLLHVANYQAPPEDLQASAWVGRVEGWS